MGDRALPCLAERSRTQRSRWPKSFGNDECCRSAFNGKRLWGDAPIKPRIALADQLVGSLDRTEAFR
jgi:hypothetical protein